VYGETKVLENNQENKDLPFFLQATDIETPFVNLDNLYRVCEKDWIQYPHGHIEKGELLIEVKGNIRKVSIVPDNMPEKTLVSGSLFKMTINDKISKHVILVYLISKYGNAFKERYQTNLMIPYLSKYDLYRIPIPEFPQELQIEVDRLFQQIFILHEEAKQKYTEAERILLEELGLIDWQPSNDKTTIKTFSDVKKSGRIDAEYYQPKYDDIEAKISNGNLTSHCISDFFDHITTKSDLQKKEYQYVEIGDINIGHGTCHPNTLLKEDLPANAKIEVKEGDILVSKVRPYRGAVAIINNAANNLIVSSAFTVLREKTSMRKEFLHVLLRTNLYRQWLLKFNVGTSYPVIKDVDVLTLPLPQVSQETQDKIVELVSESFSLRAESKHLLEEAKRMVETCIEQATTAEATSEKLECVEDDHEVESRVMTFLSMHHHNSALEVAMFLINNFGEKYRGMSRREWHHIAWNYLKPRAQEYKIDFSELGSQLAAENKND